MSEATARQGPRAGLAAGLGMLIGRSLLPIAALTIILGTLLWGPWVTLVLAFVWWKIVVRYA